LAFNGHVASFRQVRHRPGGQAPPVSVDPVFNNTEEWWQSIPAEIRPRKDQPFYHLLAENEETEYVAYVSEQNLLIDDTGEPVRHPQVRDYFEGFDARARRYRLRAPKRH
jgi:heat shock protein HspQ